MKYDTSTLIELARKSFIQGQREAAADCLAAVLAIDPANLAAHNLREEHSLSGCFSDWIGVDARISPEDDIYKFFVDHPSSINPLRDYLTDGWRTLCELQSLLETEQQWLGKCRAFLEFASGHGRFTRHLVRRLQPGSLTVSDVVPGSVDFLRDTFGVKGFYSASQPQSVEWPEKYSHVFVLSLFSHLPEKTWGSWLRRLYEALAPDGLLIISTHGLKSAHLSGVNLPESGYAFFPSSESHALEGQEYGTTFTSPEFVTQTVRREIGQQVSLVVHPEYFWANQDAVIIRRHHD